MSSNYNINGLIEGIKDVCIDKGIDWIITAIITYFSARYATRCYYDKTRVMVAKNTMEQGLRALLKLTCDEKLPDNAKVIFVEYKGRCWDIRKCKKEESDCHFGGRIRKTVAAVGGDIMGISAFKPRDYGVLGLANELGKPVLFNFQNGMPFSSTRL